MNKRAKGEEGEKREADKKTGHRQIDRQIERSCQVCCKRPDIS